MGTWVSYGLGEDNRNLPGFVSLSNKPQASRYARNGYLPGPHQGTPIDARETSPEKMVKHLRNLNLDEQRQRRQLDFVQTLNETHHSQRGPDDALEPRIRAMETAFRMQFSAADALGLSSETRATREEYGDGWSSVACDICTSKTTTGTTTTNIERNIEKSSREIDRPIAALLRDLKRRGLLDETLVVWGGEFGRTPVSENGDGRDHNPYGFTVWMAGGGVKGGLTYGAADDFGFRAVQDRVSVHDLHATTLHLLGLDHERLTYRHSGRDFRLTDVHGRAVRELLA